MSSTKCTTFIRRQPITLQIAAEELVKVLGRPGVKEKSLVAVEYFWKAKEAVVITVFENRILRGIGYWDSPKDYSNQDRIPTEV
ncbi:MAG: hypothetical protein KME64_16005 [Scytonematopsis contorta HA4267-MV1]|jgi:hypothetical protein|nr:hypothetical protein [Scytonematopsis contorta HA4267-MV1]